MASSAHSPKLQEPGRIAVYASQGLGDGLLSLMVANQLVQLGHEVSVYSSVLTSFRPWAPHVLIKRFVDPSSLEEELAGYDFVIAADCTPVIAMTPSDRRAVLYERDFDKSQTMVSNLLAYVRRDWNPNATSEAGVRPPVSLTHRRHSKRVVIHPTSGAAIRDWPADKFMQLAKRLRSAGYEPVFMVSPAEAPTWMWVRDSGFSLIVPSTIDVMARYIFESGYLIGNDSGPGHLASLLDIPSLCLCARYSYLRLWRPGWRKGGVVTPFLPLPGARLKQTYWKRLLTVGRVYRSFLKLTASHSR